MDLALPALTCFGFGLSENGACVAFECFVRGDKADVGDGLMADDFCLVGSKSRVLDDYGGGINADDFCVAAGDAVLKIKMPLQINFIARTDGSELRLCS